MNGPSDEAIEAAAAVAKSWGVRSMHGEWTDEEAQMQAAREIATAAYAIDLPAHDAQGRAEAWDEGYDAAAWRSYTRTDVSIGKHDEAEPPNPYRLARTDGETT